MFLLNSILTWAIKKRVHQIDLFLKYPLDVQKEVFENLITTAKDTEWGKKHDYASIQSFKDFQERVPISTYEDMFPYIERIMKGEKNLLWPTKITWFAKSSGTTNARSKFIPVSKASLQECHYKAGKDMLSIYVNNYDNVNLFSGKTLSLGGSHQVSNDNPEINYGDVSAVIMENLPYWAQVIRAPKLETALLDKWEDKIDRMIAETTNQNITSFSGVPTWTLVLIQRILEQKKVDNILEVWPNMEVFFHGAVSFEPYEQIFKDLIPKKEMNYLEVYNASEGFFGIQDDPKIKEHPKTLTIDEVELNKNYALVISTNAGLWRYMIGDTIRFTSLSPHRIKITGRTKHFINAFGEEMIIENADAGIKTACAKTGAVIDNYTAAPMYFGDNDAGHEWLIEFEKDPSDLALFTETLDAKIREINSDYDAKRHKDIALKMPKVHALPKGTFYKWMKNRGKLGGQHKVPRLSNNREYVDDILEMINNN